MTQQQLLDQQAGAADYAQNVSQGSEGQGDVDAVHQELEQLRQRMAVIKQEITIEVDSKWVSPWRTPDVFDLKVKTRLTGHQEYRSLQDRVRAAKAGLPTESDAGS
jgi:hypothetical protein